MCLVAFLKILPNGEISFIKFILKLKGGAPFNRKQSRRIKGGPPPLSPLVKLQF
ncbi:hypothetical protein SAMN05216197_1763 [Pseudomonas graminis]|uniref:Uncharacterized protein n=1 Tax=Pseudomonas graminis TaxID=158627 RepID=A0A1I0JRM8_9PSED|nr:hypothetical protein SAMN05216197_1763 [Pseudomonas graminis]